MLSDPSPLCGLCFWAEPEVLLGLMQAVAALLQQDTSAIVTLKSSGIDRPAQLDGKRCACAALPRHQALPRPVRNSRALVAGPYRSPLCCRSLCCSPASASGLLPHPPRVHAPPRLPKSQLSRLSRRLERLFPPAGAGPAPLLRFDATLSLHPRRERPCEKETVPSARPAAPLGMRATVHALRGASCRP